MPVDQRAVGVVLQLDAEVADLVAGLDEGPPDIMRADDAELERDAALLGVADRRRHARIGHRHDEIGLDRALLAPARRRSACAHCRPNGRRSRCPAARNRYARRCRAAAAAARTAGASARPGRRPRSARRARPCANRSRRPCRAPPSPRRRYRPRRAGPSPAAGCRADRGRRSSPRRSGRPGE